MTLNDVLNTYSIQLEHDDVKFKLFPFTTDQIQQWNQAQTLEIGIDEAPVDYADRRNKADLELIAKHMKLCSDGGKKVTAAWLSKQFPQPVISDLLQFFTTGNKPAWAASEGK